jgi:Tfp pilus assembly protein PilF
LSYRLWLVCAAYTLLCFSGVSPLEQGAAALRNGNLLAAESALQQAVREQPSNALAQKLLGLAYSAQEKYALAQPHLQRACELDPTEENACYYLGRVYYSLNQYTASENAFTLALAQRSGNRGRVLRGLALTEEALGKESKAEVAYKEAIQAGEAAALVDYGMFLFHRGRGKEGLVYLGRANAKAEIDRVERALAASPVGTAAGTTQIRFTSQALPMTVKNGAEGAKHQVETMPAGVAVFDYNNDGWPDIYVANGAAVPSLSKTDESYSNRLFRNNGDGTFTDITTSAGVGGTGFCMGVAAADFDNDGHVDLFVTGVRTQTLYRNRGDGTFEDVTGRAGLLSDGRWSVAAGWFDYDKDGWLDLFVVRYVEWDPATEPYCGLQKPEYRTYCHPKHYKPLPSALFHNEGNGKFRDVSGSSGIGAHLGKGMGVVFADFDRDGWLDAFVTNDSTPNFLFHNRGNGTFQEIAMSAGVALNGDGVATSSMGADFRDYDNDGSEDLFVTNLTNERFLLFRNLGGRQFGDVSGPSRVAGASLPWTGWSTGMMDFNNDGRKDLFVAGGNVTDNAELTSSRQSRQPNLVFINQGGGKFAMQELPGTALHRGAAFGDFNRDGRIDVVVTRLNEAPLVLINTTPAGHWLELRLEGTRSNDDGLGAEVHLVSDSGEQWNRATTSVGYGGSSDRIVTFGLGRDAVIKLLEVQWPSGAKQILTNVRSDQLVTVREER